MKRSKLLALAISAVMTVSAFAGDLDSSFSMTVDFALSPATAYVQGDAAKSYESHFAPVTGAFGGVEGRVVGDYGVVIPTPLGENWLVKDANVKIDFSGELTPVTIKPMIDVTFTPLPFLVFSCGAQAGTGWNLAGLQGMALCNEADFTYSDITPFKGWFYKGYAQGVFQFDLGAVIPGDWTHVLMMYTYQAYYQGMSGVADKDIWMWQCGGNKVNGLLNYQSLILAYGLPNDVIKRVGVMTEVDGYYSSDSFKADYKNYNGAFKSVTVSPLAQFQFGEKDALTALFSFGSRRSFAEAHTDSKVEPKLTFTGREWYFYRGAVSYSHSF